MAGSRGPAYGSGVTSAVRLLRSTDLRHAEYADAAVVAEGSELLLLAGVCPLEDDGTTTAPGDLVAQTRRALENLDRVLAACGAARTDLAFLRILVASSRRDDLGAAWTAVREHLGDLEVPATLLGVTVLGYADQLVEIEATAARPAADVR